MVAQNIMRPFVLYVPRCADGSYYVGHTDDLEKRIFQHETGELCGYTSRRRPVTLLYACEFATRAEALQRELQLKGWSRAKKEALIREDWSELRRLSRPSTAPVASRRAPLRANGVGIRKRSE